MMFDSKSLNPVTPARNPQAEEAVIGSILNTPANLLIAAKQIQTSDAFYDPKHKAIYNAILLLASESEPIDLITVTAKLREIGKLEQVGGVVFLTQLASYAGYGKNLEYWCRIVNEDYARRQLLRVGLRLAQDASDVTTETATTINRAKGDLDAISHGLTVGSEQTLLYTSRELLNDLDAALNRPEDTYLRWYAPELDRKLTLMSPSADLIILAGSPGCGKTSLAMHTALTNALNRVGVGIFSLEMPRKDLVRRMAVSRMGGRYTNDELRKGYDVHGQAVDVATYQQALSEFMDASLFICDEGGLDIQRLTLIALDWKHRHGIRLIVIDYLQLLQDATVTSNTDTARISSVSRKLKALAKLLNIPIIAISNLSKAAANSGDGRPHKEHLRESGQIEFDADSIALLYRPKYHGIHSIAEGSIYPAVQDTKYLIQVQVEKNRNGPCSVANVWADVATNRFFDLQPGTIVSDTPF